MYLDFEGKKITFDKYIINLADLANYDNDLNKFSSLQLHFLI